ncbi:MAG: DegT/DnrJ/EryC1/StrS family aminotransferase [Ruminococcaceae bacterium]|nr:DegT/DnrJ/EryC1/StrS family aminotransferase [Oscillospiraceae bacterium]MBE6705944.1 DegT/DnrJ/EryC1/StrS family aminotransferase [Oscillospiraceae bacterium]
MSELALFGGNKAVTKSYPELFKWPIITKEDEDAVLNVLRAGAMSGTSVTMEFEKKFAEWNGTKYALGFNNGTASLQAAMYGCGVRKGDEVICPTVTYWASGAPALSLGATVVFANIERDTLCIDPDDIERCISPRTKAIICVHYVGYPCDMDRIMAIAKKHNIKVIEDVSHAQGGYYKGRKLGSIGDAAGMSLMSGKSFAVGEAGMLLTNDKEIYDHAISLGHYERMEKEYITSPDLIPYLGLPAGGYKYRMHQLSSAVGLVQLKYYDERCAEIRKAMNYFWDLLEGVPGIRAHRVDESTGSNMAGWYAATGLYRKEELGGLSVTRFCEAVRAEGASTSPGCNRPLHTHGLFNTFDVYGAGAPTRVANADRDVRELDKELGRSEEYEAATYSIPWFKHYDKEVIEQYANAFKKVALNYKELLADDPGDSGDVGGWHFFAHTAKKKS